MAINESLIKPILEFLNEKYPDHFEHHTEILPQNENREEIRKCLLHCKNNFWIDFDDNSTRDNYHYMRVKITNLGLEYFKKIS